MRKSGWEHESEEAREHDDPTLDGGSATDREEQGLEKVGELGRVLRHNPHSVHVSMELRARDGEVTVKPDIEVRDVGEAKKVFQRQLSEVLVFWG